MTVRLVVQVRVQEVESQCRNLDPAEAAKNKDFCCELKDGLKISYPIQGQMAIASRKWCDLVICLIVIMYCYTSHVVYTIVTGPT